MKLIVSNPFGGYEKGACITDPAEVERVQREHAADVIVVAAEEKPPGDAAAKRKS